MDLDRPDRFLNVLFRPQWKSWLVKGGYTIGVFGLLVTVWGLTTYFQWDIPEGPLLWITAIFGMLLAIYTAFLFAQAKGRDFWQSPLLPVHMLVHSVVAGAAVVMIASSLFGIEGWMILLKKTLLIALGVNMFTMIIELTVKHPTTEAESVAKMITSGKYSTRFWIISVGIGTLVPMVLLLFTTGEIMKVISGICILIGVLITEMIWVEAPQRIPLA